MTNKVLGGGSLDGSLGLNPDFSTLTIPLGRVVQSVDNEGYIQYWIIEETLKAGGNALANGLYANSTTLKEVAGGVSKLSVQNRQAIEAAYKAQGYNNVFFFEDGFTYTESNDVGIYEDGTAWTYADTDALPVIVTAGTVPSETEYQQVTSESSVIKSPRGYGKNNYAVGISESGSVGSSWDYTHLINKSGFVSSDTSKNLGWLTLADTFQWIEVETPFGVIIGDSIAEGHPAEHGRLHPDANIFDPNWPNSIGQPSYHLAQKTNMYWYNHGIGGQTTEQVLERWRRDVLAETFDPNDGRGDKTLDRPPYCVWVNAGINDISYGVPVETTKQNLIKMAESARDNGILVGFNTVGPNNTHTQSQMQLQYELSAFIKQELPKYGAYVFDYRDWFRFAGTDLIDNRIRADSVHPSRAGYMSYVSELIKTSGAPIVMEALNVEGYADPDSTPTNFVETFEYEVESISGEKSASRVTKGAATIPVNFDMTNSKTVKIYPRETSQFPASGSKWAAITGVSGVFRPFGGTPWKGETDSYLSVKCDNGVYSVVTTYPYQNIIDVSVVGTSHLKVRFTKEVSFLQISSLGNSSPYDISQGLVVMPSRELIIYIIDKSTGLSIDPLTAVGVFFFNVAGK